jgi:adenosylhomocysteine nucleosidase
VTAPTVYCFALHREAKPFLRRLAGVRRVKGGPCATWRDTDRDSLILVTGIGVPATRAALEWASRAPLRSVTVAGFCGALSPVFKTGDVVDFGEVIDESATVNSCGASGPRLLTASRIVAEPEEKRRLAERFGADAVDMESAATVRWCRERAIPIRVIRAVSDDARTRLSPRLARMLSGGSPSLVRVIGQLFRSPRLLPELLRLASHTRLAAERLAVALI